MQIALADLGVCKIDETKRPEYFWIEDWTQCLKKLNLNIDVVFFGNSITAGSDFQSYYQGIKIIELGHCGDRIDEMERRVQMVQAVSPNKLFIMGGINDLHRSTPQTVSARFEHLIKHIQDSLPQTEVFVQSILPVGKEKERVYCSNRKIKETNRLIRLVAENYNCKYIDLYELYEENETLPDSLTIDGVHLLPNAYYRWANALKPFMFE